MIAMDLVRVCSSTDRDQAVAFTRGLQQAGISAIVMPSARTIGVWDVEVPAEAIDLDGALLESTPLPRTRGPVG